MEGWFDFGHPQIVAYILSEALSSYEKALGNQNKVNRYNINEQLRWGKEYVQTYGKTLLPKGRYRFNKEPYFNQSELKEVVPQCELVFLISHSEGPDEELLLLLKTAFMDGTRQYIRKQMLPTLYKACFGKNLAYCSPCFGPGLFSTPMSMMREYYRYLKIQPDLAYLDGDMLTPMSSFIGAVYGLEKPLSVSACATCQGQRNCQFCMLEHEK